MNKDERKFSSILLECGLLKSPNAKLQNLTGGVSSEIYIVKDGKRTFVVKRALHKLKVEDEWFADISRNYAEQEFINYVSKFRPDAVPKLIFAKRIYSFFAMEFLDGFTNWKDDLLSGICDLQLAYKAGALLGEIHFRSWDDYEAKQKFNTLENFEQLRIDPYLRTTAEKHPKLSSKILAEAERLRNTKLCLVHGDFSPKNILYSNNRLVVLDCEVAWFGDPSFDLSFFLNHFFLKSLYHFPKKFNFRQMIKDVLRGYTDLNNKYANKVKEQTAILLPMLMLARIDGKSPVEYITDENKKRFVRDFGSRMILETETELNTIIEKWFQELDKLR